MISGVSWNLVADCSTPAAFVSGAEGYNISRYLALHVVPFIAPTDSVMVRVSSNSGSTIRLVDSVVALEGVAECRYAGISDLARVAYIIGIKD